MSSPNYKSNKKHIYKWRIKNAENFKIYNQNVYIWKKIQKVFFNILLNN